MEGKVARNRSRNAVDSGAPPELTTASDSMSGFGSKSSHASSKGRMTASPTVLVAVTFSRSIVRHTSRGSSEPDHKTTLFPLKRWSSTTHPPAACIKRSEKQEGALIFRDALDQLLDRRDLGKGGIATPHTGEEGVVLSPHHAFGQTRSAAGVEDVAIVARPRAKVPSWRR